MIKRSVIYEHHGEWYLQSMSRTMTGLWIDSPPVIRLAKQAPPSLRWHTARDTLSASRQEVPIPRDDDDLAEPLLALAGVKSWARFAKHANCIQLQLEDNRLTITPYRRVRRPTGAFEGIEEKALILSTDITSDEIGAALEEAMSYYR